MKKMLFSVFLFISFSSFSRNITYPYPVNYFNLNLEGQNVKMAFMNVKPSKGNGGTVPSAWQEDICKNKRFKTG